MLHPAPSPSRQVITQGKVPSNTATLLPCGHQPCGMQRVHITFTCLAAPSTATLPQRGNVTPLGSLLMPGVVSSPPARCSATRIPLPLTSKASVTPTFVRRETEAGFCKETPGDKADCGPVCLSGRHSLTSPEVHSKARESYSQPRPPDLWLTGAGPMPAAAIAVHYEPR